MKIVLDIECNGLENPTQIWVVVCKALSSDTAAATNLKEDQGKYTMYTYGGDKIQDKDLYPQIGIDSIDNRYIVFRNVTKDDEEKNKLIAFLDKAELIVGHNILGYDLPHICRLLDISINTYVNKCIDTLTVSKLIDYSRIGHSVEDYGLEFNINKSEFNDYSKYSLELEERCIVDVDITELIYNKYVNYINNPIRRVSIETEQSFQLITNSLSSNGFYFNRDKGIKLLSKVEEELDSLDKEILIAFPPREVLIREFIPKATRHGTISATSVPRALRDNIHTYTIGEKYRYTKLVDFNPSSHKQVVDVLWEAGWKPEEKTKTYIDTERDVAFTKVNSYPKGINSIRYNNGIDKDINKLYNKLEKLKRYGWKISENNLNTLPREAPSPARTLARRILVESRRRTLTEWINLIKEDSRIHGRYYAIGAWTHRMAHQNPNTANIPTGAKLYGDQMRSLWCAPKNRLLVGVDAEGIQLRVFAHYIDDEEFTLSLVKGRKDEKTDPHSLNQRILGNICSSRATAKRFIYALLLGAGIRKLAEILGTTQSEAKSALDRLMERYSGFASLKETTIPNDSKRGWFVGLDGRSVRIPGDTPGMRRHLCMSGYLQNGEAVIMKMATLLWYKQLEDEGIDFKFVNFVHDEWQTEVPNNMEVALRVAQIQSDSLRIIGEQLKLKCPMAGSYWNDDHKDYTIGTNWSKTH